jgi:hypothetical protein
MNPLKNPDVDKIRQDERNRLLDDFAGFIDAYSRQGEDGRDYILVSALQNHIEYISSKEMSE